MKSVEEFIESYRAALQEAIPEEHVWGVGLLSTVGSTRSGWAGMVSPLAGSVLRRSGRALAPGFPTNVAVAVTPSRIVAFDDRSSSRIRLKGRVAEWSRLTTSVGIVPTSTADGLDHALFQFADGSRIELEVARTIGKHTSVNRTFFTALGVAPTIVYAHARIPNVSAGVLAGV